MTPAIIIAVAITWVLKYLWLTGMELERALATLSIRV